MFLFGPVLDQSSGRGGRMSGWLCLVTGRPSRPRAPVEVPLAVLSVSVHVAGTGPPPGRRPPEPALWVQTPAEVTVTVTVTGDGDTASV